MDDDTVQILNKPLESALNLSNADKRWIDNINQAVRETWNGEDLAKSGGLVFHGSEDFIRVQFEDYIMHLLASVKYDSFLNKFGPTPPPMMARNIVGNPLNSYNNTWVKEWKMSNNYRIFNKFTDEELFDIIEPKHLGEGLPSSNAFVNSRDGIAKSVSKVFGNLWGAPVAAKSPTSNSTSPSPTPENAGDNGPVTGDTADSNGDTQSLAESVETASHKSQKSMSTMSSTAEQPVQEGYFAGITRWAARRRQRLTTPSPNESRAPSIAPDETQSGIDDGTIASASIAVESSYAEVEMEKTEGDQNAG